MTKNFMILMVLTLFSCNQQVDSLEAQFKCETNDKIYISHKEFVTKEFKVFHPRNWKLEISKNEPYTSYVFSDTIPEISDIEIAKISDEEFSNRHHEFTSLTLTQDEIYQGFNYLEGWKSISNLIKTKDEFEIIENGIAKYNGMKIQWIKYNDNSNLEGGLNNLSLATLLIGENNYLTIQACVFGQKKIEDRMCKLIDVVNTITVQ